MAYQEVTRTNYGGRLKNACSGVFAGILMFIAGTVLIWWNEGRTVHTADMLKEAQQVCVDLQSIDKVDHANNGNLVHACGQALTSDTIFDKAFNSVRANAIRISRTVQYYQWMEESHTETHEKMGGTEEKVTTYTYYKGWSSQPVNSSSFHDPAYKNANSNGVKVSGIENDEVYAKTVNFGAYTFPENMIKMIGGSEPFDQLQVSDDELADYSKRISPNSTMNSAAVELKETVSQAVLDSVKAVNDSTAAPTEQFKPKPSHPYANAYGNTVYFGANPNTPEVGDVKVEYSLVPCQMVSILAKLDGNTFSSWIASNKEKLLVVSSGKKSMEEMFQAEEEANNMIKWVCRIIGLLLIVGGLKSMFSILGALFNFLPFLAHIVNFGTGFVCWVLGAAWALLVGAIAWIRYRPVLGICLLVAAAGIIAFFVMRGKKKGADKELAPAGTPAARPAPEPTPKLEEPVATEEPAQEPAADTKFCTKCGAQIPADAVFCPKCGAKN